MCQALLGQAELPRAMQGACHLPPVACSAVSARIPHPTPPLFSQRPAVASEEVSSALISPLELSHPSC